jgi:hypothetical protein
MHPGFVLSQVAISQSHNVTRKGSPRQAQAVHPTVSYQYNPYSAPPSNPMPLPLQPIGGLSIEHLHLLANHFDRTFAASQQVLWHASSHRMLCCPNNRNCSIPYPSLFVAGKVNPSSGMRHLQLRYMILERRQIR